MDIGRVPPQSIEAEQSVLGAMLLDKEAIAVATEILKAEDFYREAHGAIFDAIVQIYNRSQPVDLITLSEQLKNTNILEEVGGIGYISDLANTVPASSNVKYYAKIVEEKSLMRKLIQISSEVLDRTYEGTEEVNDLIEMAEKRIFNISQRRSSRGFTPINQVLLEAFDKIEQVFQNKGQITGISTGFIDIDNKISGMQKSDFILVAARPSMGKTAFALNIAQHAGVKEKKTVAIFSLEMSQDQLIHRMLSAETHIDSQKLRNGDLAEEDWERLANGMAILSEAPIFIDDTPGIGVMEMRSKCRRLKMEHGLDLILIDYLQLMSGDRRSESRQQEISDISRSLKALAREMDCPVVALSQLSRAPESRADHRPILSDLRESGAIEQDADVVMFLYRDEYYHPDTEEKNIGEVNIAKQRNGPTGIVKLVWLGQFTKFANLEKFQE
ncbi:replicative DNA helicase [Garciella nitratireducens]|uniref:Replicative DNA helicase n=1 Tax=Garciella nitratireducens DSM 15102 TaxID=1121911 RepID=A0A1T4PF51_9FIRM|nr:replicative DNA helicase [Garciella nitratireducens]SJZ90132.1 primary replicative DNA helicase [Garciella nitratireducens DSM 15102]